MKNREKALNRLRDLYVRPAPSPAGHGVGLVCFRPTPKGALICPASATRTVDVPIVAVPSSVRRVVHELFDGVDPATQTCSVPVGWELPLVSFLNHGDKPNCHLDEVAFAVVASRQLQTGEEATVDYNQYLNPGSYNHDRILQFVS